MFDFPDLQAQCSSCRRRSLPSVVGRTCQMPQPDGSLCQGMFTMPKRTPYEPPEATIHVAIVSQDVRTPEVILSQRAKRIAAEAYDECEEGPRKSMRRAVEAAAAAIVADNLEAFQRGASAVADILIHTGRRTEANAYRAIADTIAEYVGIVDPHRGDD